MSNLLSTVRTVLSDNVVGKLATLAGSNSSVTKSALTSMLPSLMKGIISKGSSEKGASSLLSMLKDHDMGSGTLNNLSSSLGGGDASSSFMDKGAKLNNAIFGNDLSGIATPKGMNAGSSSKLMNLATPIIMGSLGKLVKSDNLDAKGLQSYLGSQNLNVADHSKATETVRETRSTTTRETPARVEKSGGSIMRWLIPLFLLLSAGWFFTQYLGDKEATTDTNVAATEGTTTAATTTATHTHSDGTVHEGAAHSGDHTAGTVTDAAGKVVTKAGDAVTGAVSGAAGAVAGAAGAVTGATGYTVDAAGNLLKDGQMFLKSGEYTVKDGEFFDKDGKSLGFLSKVGKAIGDAGKAVGGAVAGAAGKTADAFKDVFGGMFKKKAGGTAVAAYGLSDIVFDSESHKITSFSKNEVMGLAAALKATPDAKIKVQVSSSDGGDKKVTKMRAQVVHDMLVTLGVADKQISAEGMGAGDGKVSIVVE